MKKISYLCNTKKINDMDKKKIFTSNVMPEIFYQVMGEGWIDDDTYVIVFQNMVDVDGDTFHMEVEYHKDEERITYTRVYDYENADGALLISPCFKKQIDEYILQQVGVLRNDSMLVKRTIGVELTLDVPQSMSVGEFQEWLKTATIEVNRLVPTKLEELASKVKVLGIENLGWINYK